MEGEGPLPENPEILLPFPEGSRFAIFLKREKRFLVQVRTVDGDLWVHCNNSGSMVGLLRPGSTVLISPARTKGRRLSFTLELVQSNGIWVGVNTLVPNRILRRAWEKGLIPELREYRSIHSEVRIGSSRIDALFTAPGKRLWVEAKNVTLVEADVAYFPDAATKRGQRHLEELLALSSEGEEAACFYLIQREDAMCFGPADFIDERYAILFRKALDAGIQIWPYVARISTRGISLGKRVRVLGG
jgi:sugar fermentation stimulation protein A